MVNTGDHDKITGQGLSLEQLQNWLQSTISGQGNASNNGLIASLSVGDIIHSSGKLDAQRHLDIYRGSYIARLRECMRTQFSALAYALGEELFVAFADEYLEACPSRTYTLNELGKEFPAFLESTRPDHDRRESWPDFMIGLAHFEYELSVIFDTYANEDFVTATEDTPDSTLKLTPVFRLFRHSYPICRYYLDFQQKNKPGLPFPEESYCVVIRQNFRLGLFEIKPAQYHFLSRLHAGDSVASAKVYLAREFHFEMADILAVWKEWKRFFVNSGFFIE